MAAFLTAQEPITVEVLRRGQETASVPASHRNSAYIPVPQSPASQASLKTSETVDDHDEDEEMLAGDLLVPGLDYEVILDN